MIHQITTRYFKRFETQAYPQESLTLLAGPNNSRKPILFQAAMVWNLAMQTWWEMKGHRSRSKAKDRTGVPITRQEFTALPLLSMDQLLSLPEKLYAAGVGTLDLVRNAGLPDINAVPVSQRLEVQPVKFDDHYDLSYPVRIALDKLKNLDTIPIMERKK